MNTFSLFLNLSIFKSSLNSIILYSSRILIMGFSINSSSSSSGESQHHHTHKVFLLCNYILLGAASSCIFLTLSLRLIPSLCGFLLVLLHIITIIGAISGCAAAARGDSRSATKFYGAHMVATVVTAIFQGSVSVLIFTGPADFLGKLNSYVREEDGVVILKLAGGLSILVFCLEWVVLTLAFCLNYYAHAESNNSYAMRSGKVQDDEDLKTLPWPCKV